MAIMCEDDEKIIEELSNWVEMTHEFDEITSYVKYANSLSEKTKELLNKYNPSKEFKEQAENILAETKYKAYLLDIGIKFNG